MNAKPFILIVDDDGDDREIMRDAFAAVSDAYAFEFFDNGEKLIRFLEDGEGPHPYLILLDLNMPGMDGRQTLREVKAHSEWATMPTIIMTTSSSRRDRQECYELGANLFITKPDTFNRLVETARAMALLWLP